MTVTAATGTDRYGEMVHHMAHMAAEVRGREATETRGHRHVLIPVPTSLRNATLMCRIEPLMVMSVI